jgi:hypothetical protein
MILKVGFRSLIDLVVLKRKESLQILGRLLVVIAVTVYYWIASINYSFISFPLHTYPINVIYSSPNLSLDFFPTLLSLPSFISPSLQFYLIGNSTFIFTNSRCGKCIITQLVVICSLAKGLWNILRYIVRKTYNLQGEVLLRWRRRRRS